MSLMILYTLPSESVLAPSISYHISYCLGESGAVSLNDIIGVLLNAVSMFDALVLNVPMLKCYSRFGNSKLIVGVYSLFAI